MKHRYILFIISTILLYLNFNYNIFHLATEEWFERFASDVESLVIGNLAISEEKGILYKGGLLGWNHPSPDMCDTTLWENGLPPFNRFSGWGYEVQQYPDKFRFQTESYIEDLETKEYEIYYSNPGIQAIIYKLLGFVLGVKGQNLIGLSKTINALFSALTISLFLLWCHKLFGLFPAMTVLLGILLSHWITVYGNNIFYVLGSYFLPFSVLLYYFEYVVDETKLNYSKLTLVLSLLLLIKNFLGGFEFFTVTTIMSVLPILFYALFHKYSKKVILKLSFLIVFAVIISTLISIMVLSIQISIDKGSFKDGIDYIFWTIERRSHGFNSGYYGQYNHFDKTIFNVLYDYWQCGIVYINLNLFRLLINVNIIVSFMMVLLILVLLINDKLVGVDKDLFMPLIIIVWLSILAPVSWLIIFKNHSIEHGHINPIIWHLPFLLFGYLFIGWGVKCTFKYIFHIRLVK